LRVAGRGQPHRRRHRGRRKAGQPTDSAPTREAGVVSFRKTLVSETGIKTTIHADTIERLNEIVAAHEPLHTAQGERRLFEQIPPKARELILKQGPAEELLAREPRSDKERATHLVERYLERRKAGVKEDEAYCFAVAEQFAKARTSPRLMQMAAYALLI